MQFPIHLAVILLFAYVTSDSLADDANLEETGRIIGGSDASEGMFPWTVALFNANNRFFCTASVIAPDTILTAAHCIVGDDNQALPADYFHGIAGNVNKSSPTVRVEFQSIIVHPYYPFLQLYNDIAIMKTKQPLQMTDTLQQICIAKADTSYMAYNNATAMGWGNTASRFFPEIPDILQFVPQTILPHFTCIARHALFDIFVWHKQICADGFGTGVCNGDSGGPLVHMSSDTVPVQIGITSFGNALIGCGSLIIAPAVFTRVSSYADWIVETSNSKDICQA